MKPKRLRVAIETLEAYATDRASCRWMDEYEFRNRLRTVTAAARLTLERITPPVQDAPFSFWLGKDGGSR